MNTPVYDFLINYAQQDPVRLHMPGHKGRFGAPALQKATALDITEITGADSLFEASGILAESEKMRRRSMGRRIRSTPAAARPSASRPCCC